MTTPAQHQPLTPYNIFDAKAVMKHAFYSGATQDPEGYICDVTGRAVCSWQYAAQKFLERYADAFHGDMGSPRQLLVAHDMGREYRTALFDGYKKKRDERERSPIEDEQVAKLETWIKKFLSAIGATQIGVQGVEADDVIAWLCQNIEYPKIVHTVDEDLLQLANDNTLIMLKGVAQTDGASKGVPYHLTSIAKSMLGDKSDEYGGVPGFGPAKFAHLLDTYGEDGIQQLQDIIESNNTASLDQAIEQTGDKALILLRTHFDTWRKMWMLAKLHPELCWKPRGQKLVKPVIHKRIAHAAHVKALLTEAGADDMWEQYEPMTPRMLLVDANNWQQMKQAIFEEIRAGDITAFDYETADKTPHQPFLEARANFVDMLSHKLTGASFQFGRHLENVIYVTVDHAEAANLPAAVIGEILTHAAKHTTLVAQNVYFEGIISRTNLDIKLSDVHDTRIMQRYVDENADAGLKAMSANYLGYKQASYLETLGNRANMSELTTDEVFAYATDDSLVTGCLYDLLKVLLQVDGQWEFYLNWAVNPTCVLQDSYVKGVRMDWNLQKTLHERDVKTVEDSIAELRKLLNANVTGAVTAGCESYIEAEKEYVTKTHRRKLRDEKGLQGDDLAAAVRTKVYEWKTKLHAACRYTPYSVEVIMPKFSMTPKQLSEAAEALGLNPIEKTSQAFLNEYLADYGMLGGSTDDQPGDDDQLEFLQLLARTVAKGGLSIASLTSRYERAQEKGDEEEVLKAFEALEAAEEALQVFGNLVLKLRGVEAKEIATGDELSLNSPVQMLHLIYCKIGAPVRLFSTSVNMSRIKLGVKQNSPATDEKAILTALANDFPEGQWQHDALNLLLKAKSAQTRIGLYHKPYPLWEHPKDGKVHPTFSDAGADTRRPTGSSPNVLQVSKKTPEMRDLYLPPSEDYVVVAIDYASQEIRLMACEAKDPVMISVYEPGNEKDLHCMTGSAIAKMAYLDYMQAYDDEHHELNKVVKTIRGKKAKGVNFGLAYGAGANTVSRNLIVPVEEARGLLNDALGLYARIKPWQEETAKFMSVNGFTRSAFGTKRHGTDDLFSKDKGKVARMHRQGINCTIQGTAAEMLRIVLTKMWETGMLERLRMQFFAPVYDETVSFVHRDDVAQYCREMHEIMSSATPPGHVIPQVPEFSIGHAWGSLKELGRWPGDDVVNAAAQAAYEKGLVEYWRAA